MGHDKGTHTRKIVPNGQEDLENLEAQKNPDGEEWALEDLTVKELLKKLNYHHNEVKSAFMKDGEDAKKILDEIHAETNQLKQMLESASLTPLDPEEELKKLLEDLTAELARRTMQASRIDDSEEDLFNQLRKLYEFVEPGGFELAENVVSEM